MSGGMGGGGGGGVSVGGGGGGGGAGAQGGGLCVFTCSSVLSAFGAIAALYDFDLGAESAFFAVNGLGALCFAKCQYLRLAQEKTRNQQYQIRNDWAGGGEGPLGAGASYPSILDYGVRRRRDDSPWEEYPEEELISFKKASKSKSKSDNKAAKAKVGAIS